MPDILESRWQISDQAVVNTVADEVVILHLGHGTFFGLSPVGARVWAALKEGEAPASVVEPVLETYDVCRDQLTNDLRELMAQLVANELITPA